jgi:hypothetical protein
MRNMAEYCVSAKCTDDLANTKAEIRVRIFEKNFVNNINEKSPIQLSQHDKLVDSLFPSTITRIF